MLSARQFIGAATIALSLITGAFLLALAAGNARAQGSASVCDAAGEIALLPSPWAPWKGAPLRVMLVTEKPLEGELSLTGPDGNVAATSRERHGGPPYFWFTEIKAPAAGSWHATLTPQQAGAGCGPITREIKVRPDKPGGPGSAAGSTWALRNSWNRATENLFSAWIEKLFDDPLDAEPSWPALHEVVRNPSRNFLFNHLGLNEDAKIYLRPDCADLPYTLRAYFAYKIGLPYGFSKCSRGGGGRAPTCPQWFSLQNAEEAKPRRHLRPRHPSHRPRADISGFRAHRRLSRRRLRSGPGPRRHSPNCCRSSGTASIPARGALRSPTTTLITIPCRSRRTRCAQAPSMPILTGTS